MNTPPPLPITRPVQFATFHGKQQGTIRLMSTNLHAEKLQLAQQAAVDWINANPGIEIITIESSSTDLLTAVTVWYR